MQHYFNVFNLFFKNNFFYLQLIIPVLYLYCKGGSFSSMEELLVALFSEKNVKLTLRGIRKEIKVGKSHNLILKQILKKLELRGIVYLDENDKYLSFPKNYQVAQICAREEDDTYFAATNNDRKFDIKKNQLNTALEGDIVVINIIGDESKERAEVIKILNRKNKHMLCEITYRNGSKCVVPFNTEDNLDFRMKLDIKELKNLVMGQVILAELSDETTNGRYEIVSLELIGHKDEDDIEAKCCRYSINDTTQVQTKDYDPYQVYRLYITKRSPYGTKRYLKSNIFDVFKTIDEKIESSKCSTEYLVIKSGNYVTRGDQILLMFSVTPYSDGLEEYNNYKEKVLNEYGNFGPAMRYRKKQKR